MAAGSRRELVWVSTIVLAAGLVRTLAGVQLPGPNGRSLTAVSFSLSMRSVGGHQTLPARGQ
jgi:hypothetical protein